MIEGSLKNVPLTDVFQIIATGQKTGVLTVTRGLARARIYFQGGQIGYAHVTPGVHLGEILVRMDMLTAHEVQEILRRQHSENAGTPLGLTAVEMGLLGEDDLDRALERQVLEVLGDLLHWEDGHFTFGDVPPEASQVLTRQGVDAMTLLMRVATRTQQYEEDQVEPDTVFVRRGDPTQVSLPAGAWEVLGYVDGRRSARTIAAELDLVESHVFHLLHALERLEVIEASPFRLEDPLVLVASPSGALQRLIRLALQRAGMRVENVYGYDGIDDGIAKHHPSALVLDDEAGAAWERVRDLRKNPAHGHLPVLVLVDEFPRSGPFRRLPRADTLVKPFHELALQQHVSRLVGRSIT